MSIDKIAFSGVETPVQVKQEIKKEETEKTVEMVDKEKSNAAKYMIGATALAAVIGLGIAGRNGHLGEGVQKLLGGAKKSADDIVESGEKKGGEILDGVTNETATQSINAIKRKINPELIEDKELRQVIEKLDSGSTANFANEYNSTAFVILYIGQMKSKLYKTLIERFANYQSPSELSKAVNELSAKKYDIPVKALENCADNIDFGYVLNYLNNPNIMRHLKSKIVLPKDVKPEEKLRIVLNAVAESTKERLIATIEFSLPNRYSNATQDEKTEMIEKSYKYILKELKMTRDFLSPNVS